MKHAENRLKKPNVPNLDGIIRMLNVLKELLTEYSQNTHAHKFQ